MSAIQNLKRVFSRGDSRRQYHVYGEIVFTLKKLFDDDRTSSPELREQMLQAIREVDELHPWKDIAYDGAQLPSIDLLQFKSDQFNNWTTPELNVWFLIEPTARYITKSQMYAYEKYIETLAQKLAEREEFLGTASVRTLCHFCKSSAEFRG
jgi:hypothetical protein